MRQTIECHTCSKSYKHGSALKRHKISAVVEFVSVVHGNPLWPMVCDSCNKALDTHHLVAAVGIWVDDMGIPNVPGWESQYIRELTPAEIAEYGLVEEAASTLRRDNGKV